SPGAARRPGGGLRGRTHRPRRVEPWRRGGARPGAPRARARGGTRRSDGRGRGGRGRGRRPARRPRGISETRPARRSRAISLALARLGVPERPVRLAAKGAAFITGDNLAVEIE